APEEPVAQIAKVGGEATPPPEPVSAAEETTVREPGAESRMGTAVALLSPKPGSSVEGPARQEPVAAPGEAAPPCDADSVVKEPAEKDSQAAADPAADVAAPPCGPDAGAAETAAGQPGTEADTADAELKPDGEKKRSGVFKFFRGLFGSQPESQNDPSN
ncbi:MAG: hypothetical protein O7A68_09410, partial [Alphaproteobacteria bacterium]|nr:hypothetical protein [Alphaproteobacteria bacterium]